MAQTASRAGDQAAAHVALAEPGERDILRFSPADEAADLNFIATLDFWGTVGLQVEEELLVGFLPEENLGGKRKSG